MRYKKIAGICVFLFGAGMLLFSIYQLPPVQQRIQSLRYRSLAKTLPAGSIQAKRINAIAAALWQGKNDYHFNYGRLPVSK